MGTRSPPQETPPLPHQSPLRSSSPQRSTQPYPALLGPTQSPGAERERAGNAAAPGAGRGGEGAEPGRGVAFVPPAAPARPQPSAGGGTEGQVFTEVKGRCSSRRFSCKGRNLRWQQLSGLNSNNTCSDVKEGWLSGPARVGVGFYMRIKCLLTVSYKPKKHILGFPWC